MIYLSNQKLFPNFILWQTKRLFKDDFEYVHNEDIDTDAYIMCNSAKLVVAFRGTEFTLVDGIGIDDIITDLDVKDRDRRTACEYFWERPSYGP